MFNIEEIKAKISLENIFNILNDFGGEPQYTPYGILAKTICHNPAHQGSKKLYYYHNSNLFQCYTNCNTFDIFGLIIKVAKNQWNIEYGLWKAASWLVRHLNIYISTESGEEDFSSLKDWEFLNNYSRISELKVKTNELILKEYNSSILQNLNYEVKIAPWLKEGITQEVLTKAKIGYYPGGEQITIPHFDENNRFIGLRGRAISDADVELYGKYRPLKINKVLYTHPLGMNLYGLNWSKKNIKTIGKAIVFESEKAVLQYASYFGWDNNISVAICGSSISIFQIQKLINSGAKEIIMGLDRQFQEVGDEEFKKLKTNLIKIYNKYKNDVVISFIFDKNKITDYKASPVDQGPLTFLKLFKERIIL